MPAFDDEVRGLAAEISEARLRLGIPDQDVFGSGGLFSVRTLQLQLRDAVSTVQEGIDFFSLGVRMLASDVVYSGQVFTRASLGNTLKPREVSVRPLHTPLQPPPQDIPCPVAACTRLIVSSGVSSKHASLHGFAVLPCSVLHRMTERGGAA